MNKSHLDIYRLEKDHIRENLNKYTRKAFNLIPPYKKPCILDVGCGTGVPTIELAKLSSGHIIGIDIDEISLELFQRKVKDNRLENQIEIIKGSFLSMDFSEESFDIIWSEGSIFVIGFLRGLKRWRQFLKPNGFLVIHDEKKNKYQKLGQISRSGYALIDQFDVESNLWWQDYYAPLEQLIYKFRQKYSNDTNIVNAINEDQFEIDKCKTNPQRASSFYVILQKV